MARRGIQKPVGNPTPKLERLPEQLIPDLRTALEGTERGASGEASFYANAVLRLLNEIWGLDRASSIMKELGLDAQGFIELLIGAMREIHELHGAEKVPS